MRCIAVIVRRQQLSTDVHYTLLRAADCSLVLAGGSWWRTWGAAAPRAGRSCSKHNNRRPSSAAAAFIRKLSANRRFSFTIASAASPHSVGYSGADESPSHCTWQSAISWRHHSTAAPIVQRKQQRRRADFLAGQLRKLRRELGGERRWDRHAEADGA